MKLERRAVFGWPATTAGAAPCRNGLVVHYDGSRQNLAVKKHDACRAYWKATRRFHMGPDRGWLDIGYSFAVCPHGVVMEGRGWQHQQAAQPGGNTTWTSCTFMSGDGEKPTKAQLEAFAELRAWLRGKGLGSAIKGHRDFISTSCPGSVLYGMVRDGSLKGVPAKPSIPGGRLLRLATPMMRGDDVTWVQRQLNAHGAKPPVGVDGAYGPKTAAQVKDFQHSHHLEVDGIVGEKTRAALARPVT